MNIYVGNMSYTTTEETLTNAFSAHGAVESVRIITDRETGRAKGFAFVEMTNKDEAMNAISALNGTDIDGRTVTINEAAPKPNGGGSRGGYGSNNRGGYGSNNRGGYGGGRNNNRDRY